MQGLGKLCDLLKKCGRKALKTPKNVSQDGENVTDPKLKKIYMDNDEIKAGKKVFIRNAGKDEYWLQDLIYENPSILGLGELIPVSKEKRQSSGGKLDVLLKNPEDNSMYEIEVMLGETDPSHIIRTIEYWDIEKRRYPQRQHFPVLIAEAFNKRYFNVI